eukprot:Skav223133  [mRNA]  locus=scaffold470:111974:112780:+ [translate_table: standard]
MKTSLKYTASYYAELLNSGLFNAKVAVELAGPPGNVSFLKSEATVKAGVPFEGLGRIWQGHLSMGCGLLFSAGRSCPLDRFHLGGASGASALKGFADREVVASLFAAVSTAADVLRLEGAQLLGFVACGTLQPSLRGAEPLRVSVGAGVALPLGPGSLELTFAQPLRFGAADVLQRWQLGLRLHIE